MSPPATYSQLIDVPVPAHYGLLPGIDLSAPLFSIDYRRSDGATDMAFEVQECPDLSTNAWTTAVGTNLVLSDDGIIQSNRFTVPVNDDAKFLRVWVSGP